MVSVVIDDIVLQLLSIDPLRATYGVLIFIMCYTTILSWRTLVVQCDIVEIHFGQHIIKVRIEDVKEHALKNDAPLLYTVLENS